MNRRNKRTGRRRGPGWKEYLLAMAITVLTGLVVGVLVGEAFPPGDKGDAIGQDPTASDKSDGGLPFVPHLKEPMNVLVMATDVNYTVKDGKRVMGLNGNTDTMILVRLDPGSSQVRMLSIPRDTRVPIPGHGTFKINAANPYGGPALSARVVADFLNVQVDRYVLLNTRAVVQIVDAMGGINVFVPKRLHYNDFTGHLHINLNKGWNFLDGQHAHDFLRFRHDELGDIGRVQRQQAFTQALLAQYMTPLNLLKTPQLLAVAKENLETNLSNQELVELATWAKDIKREDVQLCMVPGVAQTIEGGSYWVADQDGVQRVVGSFLTGDAPQEAKSPAYYKIAIRDGVGDRQSMRRMRKLLAGTGYGAVELDGLAPEQGQAETQIIAQKADVAGAKALADALGVGKVVVAATGNIYTDFTVVIGRDWLDREAAPAAAPVEGNQ
jgi:LCP family protein required for cell wall assembly